MVHKRAFDILNVSLVKLEKPKVKIEDVTHLYKTRSANEVE